MARIYMRGNLKIQYDCGMDQDGKSIVKSKTYGTVEQGADDAKLNTIVNAIVDLQKHNKMNVSISETYDLM